MVDQSNYDVFPYDSNDVGTITPYTPTNAEKRVAGLASLIRKIPGQDSNYWSRHTAQNFLKLVDPKQQGGIGEYLPGFSMKLAQERNDRLGEALSYLDLIPGGGAGLKMAVIPAVAKYNDKIRKLKFNYNREMKNANGGDGQAAINAANKIQKQIRENIDKRNKVINNITDPGERKAAELSTGNIFHGSSTSNIKNFKLPEHLDYLKTGQRYPSSGGLYSVTNPADPRFKSFSKGGSGYEINPNFNRTLDVDDMPSDVIKDLDDMYYYIGRPSRNLNKNTNLKRQLYQLDTMLYGGAGSVNKTPAQFSQEVAKKLKNMDYDSLVFPPRNFKGEGETILSLDPSNTLNLAEEIPFDEIDDFIRAYLNPK